LRLNALVAKQGRFFYYDAEQASQTPAGIGFGCNQRKTGSLSNFIYKLSVVTFALLKEKL
jgi:hypothetical protein